MQPRVATYLDSNAGAPVRLEVAQALLPLLEGGVLSNPSSVHSDGRKAKRLFLDAADRVALSLGSRVSSDQLIFTSSGTEANQLAIRSVLEPLLDQGRRPHWVLSPVEHDSILQMTQWLEGRGGSFSFLPLDENGVPKLEMLSEALRSETALISLIWVNNETGAISDVSKAVRIAKDANVPIHLDGAQAWGKLPLDLMALGAQYVSLSAHKIGALAGTGILWVQPGRSLAPLLRGKQQRSRRGGTENLIGIVAAGAAAATLDPEAWRARVEPLRDWLQNAICNEVPDVVVNAGHGVRVANTLNLSFKGIQGDLVAGLDLAGFSLSAGSACAAGIAEPSHVLLAMGRSRAEALSALRISLVDELPLAELQRLVSEISRLVARAR